MPKLSLIAHKLKSSFSAIGAEQCYSIADKIEYSALEGREEVINRLFQELIEELFRLSKEKN